MTDIATLRGLIARLNAATGRDSDLDADIRIACPERNETKLRRAKKPGTVTATHERTRPQDRNSTGTFNAPDYTAKLDAAVSLYPDQHRPSRIPSTPRAACVEALCVRIAMLEGRNNG